MANRNTTRMTPLAGLTLHESMAVVCPWISMAVAARAMTSMPRDPTSTAAMLTLPRMGPLRQYRSNSPIISRLNRLLPKASPTARSGLSAKVMELTPTPNSGRDVAVASSTTPMKARPRPVLKAMTSADLARKLEAPRMMMAAAASMSHRTGRGSSSITSPVYNFLSAE